MIYVFFRNEETMKINVRAEPNGSITSLKVKGWYTIANIKNMIESTMGIPVHKQHLHFGLMKLENHKTLVDLNVTQGQTLDLLSGMCVFVASPGGMWE